MCGGSDPIQAISDTLASVDPGPAIGSGLASVDQAVNSSIPGGWYTLGGLAAGGTGLMFAPEIAAAAGIGADTAITSAAGQQAFFDALASGAASTDAISAGVAADAAAAAGAGAGAGDVFSGLSANAPVDTTLSQAAADSLTASGGAGAGTGIASNPVTPQMIAAANASSDPIGMMSYLTSATPEELAAATGAGAGAGITASDVLSGLSAANQVKNLASTGYNLLTGKGGSNVSGAIPGSSTTAQSQQSQNAGYDNTIANLTPGLTRGSQFKFVNEPVFNEARTSMPMQAQPDYTQQILNAAQGGLVSYYAEGGEVPEAPSPYLKPELFRGHRFSAINRFNSAQMPGYQPRQFADGGEVEGHNPQFFSEGGLNSLENRYVQGDGDGTSDSVPAMLANGEFVVPADVVSKLGNGSNEAGANVLDQFLSTIREHAQKHDPKDLPPDSKGPLAYLLDAKRKA
jgi:hypothetical protein